MSRLAAETMAQRAGANNARQQKEPSENDARQQKQPSKNVRLHLRQGVYEIQVHDARQQKKPSKNERQVYGAKLHKQPTKQVRALQHASLLRLRCPLPAANNPQCLCHRIWSKRPSNPS
jgi:hypothetical protein